MYSFQVPVSNLFIYSFQVIDHAYKNDPHSKNINIPYFPYGVFIIKILPSFTYSAFIIKFFKFKHIFTRGSFCWSELVNFSNLKSLRFQFTYNKIHPFWLQFYEFGQMQKVV
jgi:hypothetical protein